MDETRSKIRIVTRKRMKRVPILYNDSSKLKIASDQENSC